MGLQAWALRKQRARAPERRVPPFGKGRCEAILLTVEVVRHQSFCICCDAHNKERFERREQRPVNSERKANA
jgi:hypothetical protein